MPSKLSVLQKIRDNGTKYPFQPARAVLTYWRTAYLGASGLIKIRDGEMDWPEARERIRQTGLAAIRGDLSLRQAANTYLSAKQTYRGIDCMTLDYLEKEYRLEGRKQELFECILFGGYEAWLNAHPDLRAIARCTEINAPTWNVEILKDLFSGVISKKDWELIVRVMEVGQGEAVFSGWRAGEKEAAEKMGLLQQIRDLDDFISIEKYVERVQYLTGIAEGRISPPVLKSIEAPPVIEVASQAQPDILRVKNAAVVALERLDEVTFAAVVGGSAERMNYVDENGKALPQATFPFLPISNRNMFSLHAEEILALKNLYFLVRERVQMPVRLPYFMMTNAGTDGKIMEDFEGNGYHGLGKRNVRRVVQTLVPVVSADGRWLKNGRYSLNTKPHGHGDFWKLYFNSAAQAELAEDLKLFTVVIQGNNPFVFGHMLEYIGLGIEGQAAFGFSTCPREVGAPEGAILLTRNTEDLLAIRNVEYPVMQAFGVKDEPGLLGNLNMLFANNEAVARIIRNNPFPGEIINLQKPQDSFTDPNQVKGGRGEAQMQGVAEVISAPSLEELPVFVLNAPRGSDPLSHFDVFKNEPGKPRDTVATCRQNYSDRSVARLINAGVDVEHQIKRDTGGKYLPTSNSVIELTPAFANRQDILKSKITGGHIAEGSAVYLSGFHARIKDLNVFGSLEINVINEIGDTAHARSNLASIVPDAARAGKYRIEDLTVRNEGWEKVLDRNGIWQGEFKRPESCRITIEGNGELVVEPDTVILGNFDLTVHDGEKVTLSSTGDRGYSIRRERINRPSWKYEVISNLSADSEDLFELKQIEF